MSDYNRDNKRVAKNTLLLYGRMLFIMIISLFTSRVNLQSLGVSDYGIYNVVGGVVAMFSIFSSSLASAIGRFFSFEIGKADKEKLKSVFSTTVSIQIILALFIIIIIEPLGLWFINNKLVIPLDRLNAAHWVFQCSVLSFVINLISVPYNSVIISHEKMGVFAYISIFEVIMRLLICYSLFISLYDKLITYAVLLLLLSLVLRLIYGMYCKRHFEECVFRFNFDKTLFKEILGFAGWTSFTMVAFTCYTNGLSILLNIFFGPTVNAARAISTQVQNAIQSFLHNFQVAINPQIIKSYANSDIQRMFALVFKGTKFSYFLMYFISLPIILEIDQILAIWLTEVPDYTANFVRLILVIVVIDSLGGPLYIAKQASGRIRNFQLITGLLMLTILPISYICLKATSSPEVVYIVYIIVLSLVQFVSMLILYKEMSMPIKEYCKNVLVPIFFVSIFSPIFPVLAYFILPKTSLLSFIAVCLLCIVSVVFTIYLIGLTNFEKQLLKDKVKKIKISCYEIFSRARME